MRARKNKALTLVELITVVAVMGVLMAIILPVAAGAQRQYRRMETKAHFHRYSLALEQFKAEYGSYPQLGTSPVEINAAAGRFVEMMTGRAVDGGSMADAEALAQNPKGLRFLEFGGGELTQEGKLRDSLGGTDIWLYLDEDGDGFLDGETGVRGKIGWQSRSATQTISSWQ